MINFKQILRSIKQNEIDHATHVICLIKSTERFDSPDLFPYQQVIKDRIKRYKKTNLFKDALLCDLPNNIGTRITVSGTLPHTTTFDRLTLARKLIAKQFESQPEELVIVFIGLDESTEQNYAEALVAAILAASCKLAEYKSDPSETPKLKHVTLYGLRKKINLQHTQAIANGNNLARQLTSQPSNKLTPERYLKEVQRLAKTHHWKIDFIDYKALQQKNAGAFLAVAQGSEIHDAGVVHLRYEPKGRKKQPRKRVCLVGKGICYDTGGTNLKSSKSMFGMHEDMEGSAVAIGTLLTLTELEVDFTVDCWLALANNMIGPMAYKQNDVVTAMNGITIEVVHTDAEGRMVLADTLALACETYPSLIIDYATLTGSCITALGTRYSGATSNRPELIADIIHAGQASGERVWPFPSDEDYDEELESQVADIKQCTLGNEADHILGARFLSRFVNNIPWIHIDLSSGSHKGGLGAVPSDITGVGVRFTHNLLFEQNILNKI